jgi:protein-tyrosine phosphatase
VVQDRDLAKHPSREDELAAVVRIRRDPFGMRRRYGTWRGLARLGLAQLDCATGRTRVFTRVNWNQVNRLVFVCRGNICRSAYAEWRARALGLPAASFGLATTTGVGADAEARRAAVARNLDLSMHRTTDATDFLLRDGDLVVAMELRHVAWVRRLFTDPEPHQVTLLGLWSRPRRPHIHDPYGLDRPYFDSCFSVIDSAVTALSSRLRRPQGHGPG